MNDLVTFAKKAFYAVTDAILPIKLYVEIGKKKIDTTIPQCEYKEMCRIVDKDY